MTGRERLMAVCRRERADRLAWTTLVDGATLGIAPEPLRADHGMAFYRHLECDIFLLNGWGTPHQFRSPALCWADEVRQEHRTEGDRSVNELSIGGAVLRGEHRGAHPVKYPVTTPADVRLFIRMWEGARYEPRDDTPALAAIDGLLGDDGITTRFWGPSPIPALLEYWMGTEAFYFLMCDEPELMDTLIRTMHERVLQAYGILAEHPCEVVILCENTSTYYISPDVYRRYNGPQVRDFVATMEAAGKLPVIHMCGHVKGLLDQFPATGMTGIHALTPPTTGDCPWELALDALGDDTLIIGAMDPATWITGPVERIPGVLDAIYTPRLRRAPFVLGPMADGIPVELERFEAIAGWFQRQGR